MPWRSPVTTKTAARLASCSPLAAPDGSDTPRPLRAGHADNEQQKTAVTQRGRFAETAIGILADGPGCGADRSAALADWAGRAGRWEIASYFLEQLVPKDSEADETKAQRQDLLIKLALAYRRQGIERLATTYADGRVWRTTRAVRSENPSEDDSRLLWANGLVFERKLQEAIDVLQAAANVNTDPRYGTAIAEVFLLRLAGIDTASSGGGSSVPVDALLPANLTGIAPEQTPQIELLRQAFHYGPHHPAVLTMLARFSTEESPDGEQARVWLKDSLAKSEAPASVHFILGTAAVKKGNLAEATTQLEQAVQRDPKLVEAANNLAYTLARTDPPQMEQAPPAFGIRPESQALASANRETRGQILLMLGRLTEAIQDLEYVVEKMPNDIQAHAGLATAYQSLGDQGLADRQTQIVEELKSRPQSTPPRR